MATPLYDWQAPISLGAPSFSEWPKDTFPDSVQNFVNELSTSTETPIELASLCVLAIVATASHGKYRIQIKEDYCEPINIWTCVALSSGSRKSAVINAATEPLMTWEKNKQLELEPFIKKEISELKTQEARIKELRKLAASNNKDSLEIQKEISNLEAQLKEPPKIPQIWTTDVTPENLGIIMAENEEKMAIVSDECGIFDILSGRYSNGIPNLDIFLQGHAGSPVRVNRGSRPPIFMKKPALTFGLVPQPEVLNGITKNTLFRGRGLLARFLYAIPLSNLGQRNLNSTPLPVVVKNSYNRTILNILDKKNETTLTFSAEAYEDWHAYAISVELRMGNEGPFEHIRDWASKLPGAIARIAGLIHVTKLSGLIQTNIISQTDVRAAIKIGHSLAEHALAVFDLMGADSQTEGARIILSWIKRNKLIEFSFRDCHYAHKSRFKRAPDMFPSIEILEERHFIRERDREKVAYRPSRKFDVNPQLYEELR